MNKLLAILLLTLSTIAFADTVPTTAIRTTDVTSICTTKTSGLRDVSESTKKEVYRRAGIAYGERTLCAKGYEVDHRASLELGGTNDISNLQLQAYCTKSELSPNFPSNVKYDARAKDLAENKAHVAICTGHGDVSAIQSSVYNWTNN